MSAPTKTSPFFLAACLVVAGGLACRKPAPVAKPEPPKAAAVAPKAATDDSAAKAQADQKRKADEAEAARKAAAEAEYRNAAQAALKDIHFQFDKSGIMESDKPVLEGVAAFMKKYSQASLVIDGNCDERGTVEYNLALGEHRAHAAMDYLVTLGVPAARLSTVSYGKEKPVCTESVESCWSKNRRAHFTLK